MTLVRRDDPSTVVFSTAGQPVERAAADVTTGVFDLRIDEVSRLSGARALAHGPGANDRFAITIVRRANATGGERLLMSGGAEQGAWELRARHRSGSLEAIVARSRRRNMAISLGVLGLLGASLVLALAAALRQQRLARQQMEFVAAVSHELRTPLAVICSAGENLADGVVADGDQVTRYGSLIRTEGRRSATWSSALWSSPASAGTAVRRAVRRLAKVIAEATDALRPDARDRGVTLDVHSNGPLPRGAGDVDALRSAVQNIVGNALITVPGAPSTFSTHFERSDPRASARFAWRPRTGIDPPICPTFQAVLPWRRAVDAQVARHRRRLSVCATWSTRMRLDRGRKPRRRNDCRRRAPREPRGGRPPTADVDEPARPPRRDEAGCG